MAYWIAPGEVWPLQVLYGAIDFALILLLLRIAKPHFVLLYAWSPLIIKEFAITAHPDVLGAFFIILSFIIYSKNTKNTWLWLPICLALATGVKIFALLVVPLFLRFHWRSWCVWLTSLLVIAIPFTVVNGNKTFFEQIHSIWFPDALQVMSNNWIFNAPLYYLTSACLLYTSPSPRDRG